MVNEGTRSSVEIVRRLAKGGHGEHIADEDARGPRDEKSADRISRVDNLEKWSKGVPPGYPENHE